MASPRHLNLPGGLEPEALLVLTGGIVCKKVSNADGFN